MNYKHQLMWLLRYGTMGSLGLRAHPADAEGLNCNNNNNNLQDIN